MHRVHGDQFDRGLGGLAVITCEAWCVRFLVTEGMEISVLDRS